MTSATVTIITDLAAERTKPSAEWRGIAYQAWINATGDARDPGKRKRDAIAEIADSARRIYMANIAADYISQVDWQMVAQGIFADMMTR